MSVCPLNSTSKGRRQTFSSWGFETSFPLLVSYPNTTLAREVHGHLGKYWGAVAPFVAPISPPERGSSQLCHLATKSTRLIGRNIEFRSNLWPFASRSGNGVVRQWQTPLLTLSNHSAPADLPDPSEAGLIHEASLIRREASMNDAIVVRLLTKLKPWWIVCPAHHVYWVPRCRERESEVVKSPHDLRLIVEY